MVFPTSGGRKKKGKFPKKPDPRGENLKVFEKVRFGTFIRILKVSCWILFPKKIVVFFLLGGGKEKLFGCFFLFFRLEKFPKAKEKKKPPRGLLGCPNGALKNNWERSKKNGTFLNVWWAKTKLTWYYPQWKS